MGIAHQLDLWNYFFHVWPPRDPELMVSEGVVIHVKSGHGVDPYFNIPMLRLMKGWL
jgi:hypothetical protein